MQKFLAASAGFAAAIISAATAAEPRRETYHAPDGRALQIFISEPEGAPASIILLFHGGGWTVGSPDWVAGAAARFAARGAVALAVEYRLSGDGATPADAYDDACAALKWAQAHAVELGADPNRVAAYGVSAGGHLAALTGTRGCDNGAMRPIALALYSPAIKTSKDGWFQRLLGDSADAADYSPVEQVDRATPPTLIINGDADTLTPIAYAREYCAALSGFGTECRVETFEGVGHLLTRDLDHQETSFDVSEEDAKRARAAIDDFLSEQGLLRP